MKYKVPRGTQDILPAAAERWQKFEATSRSVLERYGYREIRTPVFEQMELFLRAVGQETDIVQKEMYTFDDRKGRRFALRPEGTAPVIRSYVENSLWTERPFQKLYYEQFGGSPTAKDLEKMSRHLKSTGNDSRAEKRRKARKRRAAEETRE